MSADPCPMCMAVGLRRNCLSADLCPKFMLEDLCRKCMLANPCQKSMHQISYRIGTANFRAMVVCLFHNVKKYVGAEA
jgi:hypothetical protein